MNWTHYFDRIYIVNLPERTDRLDKCKQEFAKYSLFTDRLHNMRICAAEKWTDNANKPMGFFRTMINLFMHCLEHKMKRILVFQDDVKFLQDVNKYMPLAVHKLQMMDDEQGWDILNLGPNTQQTFTADDLMLCSEIFSLLKMKECYADHASAYSAECMQLVVNEYKKLCERIKNPGYLIFDVFLKEHVMPYGFSYCTYPMIASQYGGESDIEGKYMTNDFLVENYEKNTGAIKKMINVEC
jgi:hypothetical protein